MECKTRAGSSPLNLPDIQGLLLRGYKHFDYIRHFIFRIDQVSGAQALCKALSPEGQGPLTVTDSSTWAPTTLKPAYRLNIAFACTGLKKVIGNTNYTAVATVSNTLFSPFDPGAVSDAPRIGDVGTNAPSNWWPKPGWQLPAKPNLDSDFDMMLSLYARTPAGRELYTSMLLAMIPAGTATLVFRQDSDPLPEGADVIHFGYQDGISQPRIEGAPGSNTGSAPPGDPPGALLSLAVAAPGDDPDDRPIVPAWHFIIESTSSTKAGSTPCEPNYNAHPFLTNGSFGAFRLLHQDVEAFDKMIAQGPNPELIAAKMCGRWRDGTPLESSPDHPDPSLKGFDLTNFQYWSRSPHQRGPEIPAYCTEPPGHPNADLGQVCPYASHIRRANPRDDQSVNFNFGDCGADAVLHRVLRRARPYGPPYLEPDQADRGLVGYFIGANLQDQFSFIMQTWVTGNAFALYDMSPNQSGYDPLFGSPTEGEVFQYATGDPQNQSGYTNYAAPQLVFTRGSLYVFFPSMTALKLMGTGSIGL